MSVNPIPPGQAIITPYLTVSDGVKAIDFYRQAFGAVEQRRIAMPDGQIMHAEIKVGDSIVMLANEFDMPGAAKSPKGYGGSPVTFYLRVKDVDTTIKGAVALGASLVRPVENQIYGDRTGLVTDPFGHRWLVATHVEDVTPEEMDKRFAAMRKKAD